MQRSTAFARLKPICIALSQAALDCESAKAPSTSLTARLADLSSLLESWRSDGTASSVDAKLAEYIFFPLSHILRQREILPVSILELNLKCLLFLLDFGWRGHLAPDLGIQLLILLTFFARSKDDESKNPIKTSEDLQSLAFRCLARVFHSLTTSGSAKSALTALANVPTLGHTVTTALDAVKGSVAFGTSIDALHVLRTFVERINDRAVLSSFLPGILSSVTHVLTPTAQLRRPYILLQESLNLVSELLRSTVSDIFPFQTPGEVARAHSRGDGVPFAEELIPRLDKSWLDASAAQIKLALANIVRLRKHDRVEVRNALRNLATLIVRDCAQNLSSSVPMMLDTLIVLSQHEDTTSLQSELQVIIASNTTILDAVRSGLYDQFMSLPRTILSNDSVQKTTTAQHIRTSIALLEDTDASLSTLGPSIITALKDSLSSTISTALLQAQQSHHVVQEPAFAPEVAISHQKAAASTYPQALVRNKGDVDNIEMLSEIAASIASTELALPLVRDALDQVHSAVLEERITSFWLALSTLRWRHENCPSADSILDIDLVSEDEIELRDELYTLSVATLSDALSDSSIDWRIQALSLEAISLHASTSGEDFRPELADVLYPVLHLLGSGTPQLREHAIICVNNLASSCGYHHARDMIIQNNDYLVNGVSARLNAFDLSPEIPQVLLMLVKLTGPSLLSYLDDVVDNIFEALENFHGYPTLVGMLFAVLKGMVEEGAKSPALAITAGEQSVQAMAGVEKVQPVTMHILRAQLQQSSKHRHLEDPARRGSSLPDSLPRRPWKDLRENDSAEPSITTDQQNVDNEDDDGPQGVGEEKAPPLTKTYTLLHRITLLTQHHLPSDSSPLRASLLSLLATSIPYLAAHEDTLLPLIHTMWPVLVSRLQDREAFVVAGVLDVLAAMAQGARSFVRGRVADVWPTIQKIAIDVGAVKDTRLRKQRPAAPETQTQLPTASPAHSAARITADDITTIVKRPTPSNPTATASSPTGSTSADTPIKPATGLTAVSTTRRTATTTLTPTSPHPQDPPSMYATLSYTATTTRTIRRALESFLLALATHVPLPRALFAEMAAQMLWGPLVVERRADVREALARVDEDAVWLLLAREQRELLGGGGARLVRGVAA